MNQPNQFASSSSPRTWTSSNPAACGVALEVGGDEGVDVDDGLERVLLLVVVAVVGGRRARLDRLAPQRREPDRGALGIGGEPVARAARLAREEQRPARLEHAHELGEAGVEVGQVVQHGVAEHEVEALVLERQLRRVAGGGLDVEAELVRVVLERRQHAGADVGAGRPRARRRSAAG